ncbi:MAG TPA: hypothetical protein VFE53_11320 [Mucilaginibacter sp.]|jgi:hypothetical protein|nr:hypothetical protein [Mucilaginibacter sp.]
MEKNLIGGPSNLIHVTLPSSVSNDFEKMTKVTQSILTRLGCPNCHSGRVIIYHEENNYVVDGSLNIEPQPSPWLEK